MSRMSDSGSGGGGGGGVTSLNTLVGAITLAAGNQLSLTPVGNTLTMDVSTTPSFTSVTANTFATGTIVSPHYAQLNGNTLAAEGTDANIDLNFTTKGSGCWIYQGISTGYANSMWHMCQSSIQTTDATVTTLISIPLAAGEMAIANITLNGFEDDFLNALSGTATVSAFRPAVGNIQQIGEEVESYNSTNDVFTVDASVDVGTQAIVMKVKGQAGKTLNWVATYQYMFTVTNL